VQPPFTQSGPVERLCQHAAYCSMVDHVRRNGLILPELQVKIPAESNLKGTSSTMLIRIEGCQVRFDEYPGLGARLWERGHSCPQSVRSTLNVILEKNTLPAKPGRWTPGLRCAACLKACVAIFRADE
jgi:hypothetical protein